MRGPTSPVCRPGKPCSAPASGTLSFTSSSGATTQATLTQDGGYSISLAPGTYSVSASSQQQFVGRGLEPSSVVVGAGPRQKLDFHLDTGIR